MTDQDDELVVDSPTAQQPGADSMAPDADPTVPNPDAGSPTVDPGAEKVAVEVMPKYATPLALVAPPRCPQHDKLAVRMLVETDSGNIYECHCLRCHHTWTTRTGKVPVICAECKSAYWMRARTAVGTKNTAAPAGARKHWKARQHRGGKRGPRLKLPPPLPTPAASGMTVVSRSAAVKPMVAELEALLPPPPGWKPSVAEPAPQPETQLGKGAKRD